MRWPVLVGMAVLAVGCGLDRRPTAPSASTFPPARVAKSGDDFQERIVDPATGRRVWIYPPAKGTKPKGLVVIAPAGSNLITGATLDEDSRPEHLPYVKAGYAVVAYDVTGPMPEDEDEEKVDVAVRAFTAREAGILDGVAAIDAGLEAFPSTASNVIAAGHSSAGTLALGLTAHDPRVKKCIAYAPATNIFTFIGADASKVLAKFRAVNDPLERHSPHALVPKLKNPIFLFVAKDDSVISAASISAFANRLQVGGTPVKLVTVESGDHYDAMIDEGHPLALAWLKTGR